MKIKRVIVTVLDGVGAGELPDAAAYGDEGSNTLAHTAEAVGGLNMPNMASLGLGNITHVEGVEPSANSNGCYGRMNEASPGKDTITGHWEIAGVVLERPFPVFPHGFPEDLLKKIELSAGIEFIGNYAASGTVIIGDLGREHVLSRKPIVYTSADSVFQIAMHESIFPIERQYEICAIARELLVGEYSIGRVICRPFEGDGDDPSIARILAGCGGEAVGGPFRRTERRKDYPVTPPRTVLNEVSESKGKVHAIGKIYEIFAGSGITSHDHTTNNAAHTLALKQAIATQTAEPLFIFANLEDFDMLYGHRNDPQGFAKALELWDKALEEMLALLREGDLFIVTADHGNDPVTPSTDHSREYAFLLAYGPGMNNAVNLGTRATFADIAATIREAFGLPSGASGSSFLAELVS